MTKIEAINLIQTAWTITPKGVIVLWSLLSKSLSASPIPAKIHSARLFAV
jgi:hypothetical protein